MKLILRVGHSNTWRIQKTLSVALGVPPVIHLEIKKFKVADAPSETYGVVLHYSVL
jgi:hypothetical protein